MENINKTIQDAIEKNLSKQVGEVLQKRLKELEEIEKNEEFLKKEIIIINKQKQDLKDENAELRTLKYDTEKVANDRKILTRDQAVFEVRKQVSEHKVTSSNEKVDLMNNLVGLLMMNPKAVTMMSGQSSHVYSEEYNSSENKYEKVRTTSLSHSTTIIEEKKD